MKAVIKVRLSLSTLLNSCHGAESHLGCALGFDQLEQ